MSEILSIVNIPKFSSFSNKCRCQNSYVRIWYTWTIYMFSYFEGKNVF